MADSRPIAPGRLILVWYGGGEAYWHERLLLCRVRGTTWVIVTPDGDVYPEDIRALGGTPCLQGSVPPAIPANALLYRFPPLGQLYTAAEWRQVFDDGIATARWRGRGWASTTTLLMLSRVLCVIGWVNMAGPPGRACRLDRRQLEPAPGGPAPGMQWIAVANDGQPGAPSIGSDWSVDATASVMGKFALVKLGTATLVLESIAVGNKKNVLVSRMGELEQAVDRASGPGLPGAGLGPQANGDGPAAAVPLKSADAGVLPVLCDQTGQRLRAYTNAVGLLEEPRFEDFPVVGPRTTLWLCKFIRDQGSVPRTRTEKWMRDAHVPDNDRVKHEHGSLMEILETALTYDQLDVSALASFEILSRRIQLLEEACASNPKAPRFEGSEHFQGLGRKVAAVAPLLTSRVALQLQGEAAIQKERRKGCDEFLAKAWRAVDSVTCYPCLDFMVGKALVAHSVVPFNNVFAGVLGSTGAPTRIFCGLNVLGGFGDKSPSGPGGEQARAAAAWAREAVEAVPMPKERPAPQEALAALLRTDARCGDSECAGNVAPFGSASVSPPSRDLHGVDIYNFLPSDASHKFKRFRDAILLSDEECALRIKIEGLPNPYFDPVLEAHPAKWEGFCRDLRDSLDIKDYLHELRIDEELSQYLALPAVRAAAVGVESINGIKDGPSELSYPGEPVQLTCVDNFGVFGCDKAKVEATHRQALEGIRHAGFQVHEIEQVSTSLDIVGVHLDGGKKVVRVSPARAWQLCSGLRARARRGRCAGREMQFALGHLCFACLLRRPCLSCIAASPAFAEAAGGEPKDLWRNVKRELLIAAALLPLVYADIGVGWLDQVVATDACDPGLGACAAEWGSPDMRITGSSDERWRIKKEARGAKLGFEHVVRCGRWRRSKALLLVDNVSRALAMQKGRCRDPALVGQLRQMTALQLILLINLRGFGNLQLLLWAMHGFAVRPVQFEDYRRRIGEFYEYPRRQGLDVSTLDSLETALLDWADWAEVVADPGACGQQRRPHQDGRLRRERDDGPREPAVLGHFFKLYRQEKGASDSLWGLTQTELGAMVAKALKVCRLEGLGIAPYGLRRAGQSWGVITGRRSQGKVQRRGRWASMSSRIRHERSSKVNFLLEGLDDSVQEYLWLCTAHLGNIRGYAMPLIQYR
ncbi:unnamed protein product [Prorocentrum cordatum]|uniref:Uncharacterized protein n=1 Tax=Prorocentrum cordatum TaxID=2364126 RepID=A0ABN9YAK1_9DINO|nr:unnamed protein product [Polarella glacialis]